MEALALDIIGKYEESIETLEKTLDILEYSGCVRTVLDLGVPMDRLLRRSGLAQNSIVAEMLEAFSQDAPTVPDTIEKILIEHLTEQELRILSYLKQRFSNKEIAEHLFIAPATVKSHTIHIYQKLNVNGRRAAVEKAKNLGIFIA